MKAMQLSIQRARIVPATTVPLFSSVEQHLLLHRKRKLHSTSAALHGGGNADTAATAGQFERQGPAPAKQGGISSLDYCITQSKKLDYEHYLCGMYLPKEARAPYSVLRAFNIETAIIKDIAKQAPLGLMRIQFWRDLVDKSFKGNPPEHPVAIQIAAMVPRYKWTRTWFTRILNKRAEDIEGRPMPTLAALENFTEDTASSLLYLTLESLRIRNMDADHAASHIGKAVGISFLLRGTPYHLQQRQTYLPMDLLAKHGVSEEAIYQGNLEHAQNLPEVVYEVASAAHAHLKHARELKSTVPKEAYSALYSSFIAEDYLNKLEKAKFNGSLGLQAKLLYNHYVGHKY
ncbi:phytoene synthase family protein, putative [Acanthamoeba castellanii str. Neff]|uniref:Phytoene synthase family protein, putative n=1 Tax=Acanthamoeba castellanii (strain ATCC 30010 / Neff) TaxID=1257118 RepID=L8H1U4_ACACF|nr:phytoene synthase family protein, putative [Acanthamoeba castellanii str. Neff]ELR18356.1 phytoene synthase family protein, putative [Acanthamoeba castellanii str. Neff]